MKKSMSKTQSRNSMAKSHELPDIDNRGEQTDYKSTNRQEKQNAEHSILLVTSN